MFEEIFKSKIVDENKLLDFGFKKVKDTFVYETNILSSFRLTITIFSPNICKTSLFDTDSSEYYTLYLREDISGNFVGSVRSEIEKILNKIATTCCKNSSFVSSSTLNLIDYVLNTYGDSLEFLWENFPTDAIWRRKDNSKWYGLIMLISKDKLGLSSKDFVEVLDIRVNTEDRDKIIDNVHYFSGYHMNKRHWISVILDDTVDLDEVKKLLDDSYRIAGKSSSKKTTK